MLHITWCYCIYLSLQNKSRVDYSCDVGTSFRTKMSSQQIPGYKRHSLDEFTPEIKRQRTRASMSSDGKKTRGRVKINIEVSCRLVSVIHLFMTSS